MDGGIVRFVSVEKTKSSKVKVVDEVMMSMKSLERERVSGARKNTENVEDEGVSIRNYAGETNRR